MATTNKPTKYRVYKYASEINISTDAIIDFLKSKNYEVKNHMALMSEEMLDDLQAHFKKDIDKSEEHKRKLAKFNQIRAERSGIEVEDETNVEVEEVAIVKEETVIENIEEPVKEETATEIPDLPIAEEIVKKEVINEGAVEISEEVTHEIIEEKTEEISQESEDERIQEESSIDDIIEIEEDILEAENGVFQTDAEKELHGRKKGLTIIGKMNLHDKKRDKKKKKPIVAEEVKVVVKNQPAKPIEKKDDIDSKEADKKKKFRRKKKAADVEETVQSKKFKRVKKAEVDKREVDAAIKRTMISMDDTTTADRASAKKRRKKEQIEEQEKIIEQQELDESKIKVTEYIAVNELANLMNVSVSDVISKCMGLGLMVSINQRLDAETITLLTDEFGFEVEFEDEYVADSLADKDDEESTLLPRPPVVTIMGHVDHGKTSLLDYIRRENVVAGESGGITQHIGAYQVEVQDGKKITFLDTPGHEAFTAMRARGARVTDIVVIIVAADDAVMPQTVEAINHAQAASVPIIIAINKVDKPNSNIERIKQQLADRKILVEEWGGKYQAVEISAKTGLNVDLLLEKILLEADLLELRANPDRIARGSVVESQMEPGRGITATVLIDKGTLKIGDPFVAGNFQGRVRAMFDERNNKIKEVLPATPVLILGFEGAPQAGDVFAVVESEREAREISLKRQQLKREQDHRQVRHITLDQIAQQISQGAVKDLPIIVKGDVDGSVEALADSLMKLSNGEVAVNVIHKAVGGITEGDVLLAAASHAIIIGFHVRANNNARKLAETENVDIRLYNVIYDAINEVKSALEGLLSPIVSEKFVATVEIRDTFKVPKIGTVAGCYVTEGKITRSDKIRLFRNGIVIYEGNLATLKRFKDDVKEVVAGYECGLNISNFNDIKVNDIIEAYQFVETKQKLS
ncbi:MAG: translation initiation factor IF-2 [Bacteroidetes bacterium]|nr:translation initiation factor IF-2 [Bacteroidota bacterium]MBU1117122.1 translation initiation factor IF-2 [Bacteroidota bacterium]MBU1798653.1 translation initiation factor IF-2 [Bacteroidota bacterium]